MKRLFFVLIALLLLTTSAFAQLPDPRPVLEEERARFGPTVSPAEAGVLLARTAWRLRAEGFGLLRKDSGNRCPIPNSAATISCDWLVHQPTGKGCDVLIDGPDATAGVSGRAQPTWCAGEAFDTSRFLAPVDPGGTTPPVVEPPVEPPTDSPLPAMLTAIQQQLAELKAAIAAIPPCTAAGAAPVYEGRVSNPWLGTTTVTLTPKK